jgi:hypothetical protein
MQLNIFASRSFRDAMAYPIFPWVLQQYEKFDLEDPHNFRDLRFPITAQTPEQRDNLLQKVDSGLPIASDNAMFFTVPSNPTTVGYWLVRMPPYSSLDRPGECFLNFEGSLQAQSLSNRNWELIPEFFCQPECLEVIGDLKIEPFQFPSWAPTSTEFVYLHRKALESDYVSAHLHEWIDLVFGPATEGSRAYELCNAINPQLQATVWDFERQDADFIERQLEKSGQMPPALFEMSHPPRAVYGPVRAKSVSVVSFDKFGLVFCSLVAFDRRTLKYVGLADDRSVTRFSISRKDNKLKTPAAIAADFAIPRLALKFAGSLFCVGGRNYRIRPNGIDDAGEAPDKVELCAASESQIVFSSRKGSMWQSNVKDLKSTEFIQPIFYEKPVAIAVNVPFDLLVVGTLEGSILLNSLHTGLFRMRKSLQGSEIPRDVLITYGWGFVLVNTAKRMYLFNVNGHLIRDVELSMNVTAWCTWKNVRGFDFVAVADDKGRIFATEAFYLDFRESLYFCRGVVLDMTFVGNDVGLAVVTKEGKCFLIPVRCSA